MGDFLDGFTERVSLGLGLIQLGRPWGSIPKAGTPSDEEVRDLIGSAVGLGIKVLDTAPSYGASEARLASVLKHIDATGIVIATKAGELWDEEDGTPYVDHSYSAMALSLERSLELLGRVDLVQIHRFDAEVLRSKETSQFVDFATARGIPVGASISDPTLVTPIAEQGVLRSVQFPMNSSDTRFCDVVADMESAGLVPIVNRPYAMGKLASSGTHEQRAEAFEFISKYLSKGMILTGTARVEHLEENVRAFESVFGNP